MKDEGEDYYRGFNSAINGQRYPLSGNVAMQRGWDAGAKVRDESAARAEMLRSLDDLPLVSERYPNLAPVGKADYVRLEDRPNQRNECRYINVYESDNLHAYGYDHKNRVEANRNNAFMVPKCLYRLIVRIK